MSTAMDLAGQYIDHFKQAMYRAETADLMKKDGTKAVEGNPKIATALEACVDKYATKETWSGAWFLQGLEMVGELFLSMFGKSTWQEARALLTNHNVTKIQSKGGHAVVSEQEAHADAILHLIIDNRNEGTVGTASLTQCLKLVERTTGLFNGQLAAFKKCAAKPQDPKELPKILAYAEGHLFTSAALFVQTLTSMPGANQKWVEHIRASMQNIFNKAIAPVLKHYKIPVMDQAIIERIDKIEKQWTDFLTGKKKAPPASATQHAAATASVSFEQLQRSLESAPELSPQQRTASASATPAPIDSGRTFSVGGAKMTIAQLTQVGVSSAARR